MRRSETKMVARLATTLIAFGLGAFAIVQASTDSYDYANLKQFQKNSEVPNKNKNNNNNNALRILNYERRALEKNHASIRKRSIKEEDEDRKEDAEKLEEREEWRDQTRLINQQGKKERKRYKREPDVPEVGVLEEAGRSESSTSGTNEMQEERKNWATSGRPTNEDEEEEEEANKKTTLIINITNGEKLEAEKTQVESSETVKNDPQQATETEPGPKLSTDTKHEMTEKLSKSNRKLITRESTLEPPKKKRKKIKQRKKKKKKPNQADKTHGDPDDQGTSAKLQNGRWGMSIKGPPAEFLKDVQNFRRSRSREAAKVTLLESRFHHQEPEIDRRSTTETSENFTKPDERSSMPKNSRWGMSMTSPPAKFLTDMSRRGFVQGNRRFGPANIRGTTKAQKEDQKCSKTDDEAIHPNDSSRRTFREHVERVKPIERTNDFEGSSPSGSGMYNEVDWDSAEPYGFSSGTKGDGLLASPKSKTWKSSIDILMPSFLTVELEPNFPSGLPSFPANVRHRETRARTVRHKVPVVCTFVSYSEEFGTLCRFIRDISRTIDV